MTNAQPDPYTDEFYVGYFPIPKGHRRFVIALVSMLTLWSLAMAIIITMTMRNPGSATWNTGTIQTWSGTLLEHPYPVLIPDDTNTPPHLVVSMGKRGAHNRLAPYFGKHVTLIGYELYRDGRHLIELSPEPEAIVSDSQSPLLSKLLPNTSQEVTLVGEIVDGKCYLGAMKPADGLGHRACAVLCIRGGLPPMFVTETPTGQHIYHLLTIDGTTQYNEDIYQLVGQQVTLTGQITSMHGLQVLETTTSSITPHSTGNRIP